MDPALKVVPLFSTLSEDELGVVKALAVEKKYPKGVIVVNQGDAGDSLYIVTSGKVKVFISDEEGRELILKWMGAGDFFGELSLIDKRPRSASVETVENSVFHVLSDSNFDECVRRAPRIAKLVMQALTHRLREADRKIGSLGLMDVYGRVASTLLELAVYKEGRLVVGEKLSQQELANMVGASREMVNRVLKDLADRGFISIEQKSITIIRKDLPPSLS